MASDRTLIENSYRDMTTIKARDALIEEAVS
jgi:hypothetical protein